MTAMNKREMRALIRTRREGRAIRDGQSRLLCSHILKTAEYMKARVIAGYIPMDREADIIPVLQDAIEQGKILALPRCGAAPVMSFHRVMSLTDLTRGIQGILEPDLDAPVIQPEEIDLALVPLEGIDRAGVRLGKGGGYYDCFLSQTQAFLMGCALLWQWVEKIPCDIWDVPLHACVDANGLHRFNRMSFEQVGRDE